MSGYGIAACVAKRASCKAPDLVARERLCVLIIEHDLDLVRQMISSRIILLHRGRVALDGSVADVVDAIDRVCRMLRHARRDMPLLHFSGEWNNRYSDPAHLGTG
jgi:ABC-type transporter Mla maintaining outer membrane lipid asymmetry ATPase subunit MlaF